MKLQRYVINLRQRLCFAQDGKHNQDTAPMVDNASTYVVGTVACRTRRFGTVGRSMQAAILNAMVAWLSISLGLGSRYIEDRVLSETLGFSQTGVLRRGWHRQCKELSWAIKQLRRYS